MSQQYRSLESTIRILHESFPIKKKVSAKDTTKKVDDNKDEKFDAKDSNKDSVGEKKSSKTADQQNDGNFKDDESSKKSDDDEGCDDLKKKSSRKKAPIIKLTGEKDPVVIHPALDETNKEENKLRPHHGYTSEKIASLKEAPLDPTSAEHRKAAIKALRMHHAAAASSGGPTHKDAEETLRFKFGYSQHQVDAIKNIEEEEKPEVQRFSQWSAKKTRLRSIGYLNDADEF